jgi:hypothetical protein
MESLVLFDVRRQEAQTLTQAALKIDDSQALTCT